MYHNTSLLIIILALIYPFCLTKLIKNQVKATENKSIKEIIKNIILLILITLGTICISLPILEMYDNTIPSSTDSSCTSSGGLNHTCTGNNAVASIYFVILGIVFIAHNIISYKFIYKIFSNSKKIFPYIFTYIFMAFIYFCQIILLIYLYGLFKTVRYSLLVNILRIIVILIPSLFYLVSIHIKKTNIK